MQHAILHARLGEIHLSETGLRYLDATNLKGILTSACGGGGFEMAHRKSVDGSPEINSLLVAPPSIGGVQTGAWPMSGGRVPLPPSR